jgi:hypothetical protein
MGFSVERSSGGPGTRLLLFLPLVAALSGSSGEEPGLDLLDALKSGEWAAGYGMAYEAPPPEGESIRFFLRDGRETTGIALTKS